MNRFESDVVIAQFRKCILGFVQAAAATSCGVLPVEHGCRGRQDVSWMEGRVGATLTFWIHQRLQPRADERPDLTVTTRLRSEE